MELNFELLALSRGQGPQDGKPMACSRKLCAGRTIYSNRNEMMLPISRTFSLTHDDHLPHNTFASVARRCSDRLQLGMSDFLRRNPHRRRQPIFQIASKRRPQFTM